MEEKKAENTVRILAIESSCDETAAAVVEKKAYRKNTVWRGKVSRP